MWVTVLYILIALYVLALLHKKRRKRSPDRVVNVTLEQIDMNLRIQWPANNVAADQRPVQVYRVEMRSDPSFDFEEVAVTDQLKVVLPDLAAGTYFVRVRADDGTDKGAYSDEASITLAEVPVTRAPDKVGTLTLSQE